MPGRPFTGSASRRRRPERVGARQTQAHGERIHLAGDVELRRVPPGQRQLDRLGDVRRGDTGERRLLLVRHEEEAGRVVFTVESTSPTPGSRASRAASARAPSRSRS